MTLAKNILLGITGGIAAYKSPEIVRRLRERGADVRVVMTEAARAFITPMTLQTVSGHPVPEHLFDPEFESAMGHIELARWADCICIAPASADCIARLTYGHANDLLTTLCLASHGHAEIVIAPAMNPQMWHAAITQQNIATLQQRGITILGPSIGETACGEQGYGRMLEPEEICQALLGEQSLRGMKVLITAGPTREAIDPVRYISNHSSGKMGFALAQAALLAGAEVTLITGPTEQTCSARIQRIDVLTAEEMQAAVLAQIEKQAIFIAAAAVADYRVQEIATTKIKKNVSPLTLQLIKNPDILATVAKHYKNVFCVGFAAETENMVENAKRKLQNKQVNMIIANQVGWAGQRSNQQPIASAIGFESDHNAVTVISRNQDVLSIPITPKTILARQLIEVIAQQIQVHQCKEMQHVSSNRRRENISKSNSGSIRKSTGKSTRNSQRESTT